MLCLPELTLETDVPCWISKATFFSLFDLDDFECRDQRQVIQAYLNDWFFWRDNGILGFFVPTVNVVSGKTQFINGRHRTAVLLNYLEEIPMAFAVEHLSLNDRLFFDEIPKGELSLLEPINIPDLDIFISLPPA